MTVLVTGASGHLGANLVRRLLAEGQPVRVLARRESNNAALDGLEVERVYGDLRDAPAVLAAVRGCKRVYHCGARVATGPGGLQELFESNVLGTRNVLRAGLASGVERVVVSGSFSAVGHNPTRPSTEDDPFNPFGVVLPYGHTKAAVEHECLKAVVDGLDVVVATSCAILGPHDYKPSRLGRVLLDFANGRPIVYLPGGTEFVAARDIVEGHLLAMEKGRPGHRYLFSTQFVTVDELLRIYRRVTGRHPPLRRLPAPLVQGLAEVASLVTRHLVPSFEQRLTPGAVRILRMNRRADCTRARQELGYEPTSVAQAVAEAYDDFVRRGLVRPARARS